MSDTTTTLIGEPDSDCVFLDIYQGYVSCDYGVEPCSGDGVSTLYHAIPCDATNPTMAEWCTQFAAADHPLCVAPPTTTTIEVAVGPPPTLPPAGELPATGVAGVGGILLLALWIAGIGAVLHTGTRWTRRRDDRRKMVARLGTYQPTGWPCLAISRGFYKCTLPIGHDGVHQAWGSPDPLAGADDDELCATWADEVNR
jgi:hypothetical protein